MQRQHRMLTVLGAITLIAVVIALVIGYRHAPITQLEQDRLLPTLRENINHVRKIVITERATALELSATEDGIWVVSSSDDYPALLTRIRKFLLQLGELSVLEKKTRDSSRYYLLDVADPGTTSASKLVELYDAEDTEITSLIIGRGKSNNLGGVSEQYVRLQDSDQALLVKGTLDAVSNRFVDWAARRIMDISSHRVRQITIQHIDGEIVVTSRGEPGQADLELQNIPSGRKAVSSVIMARFATLLEELQADNVKKADGLAWDDDKERTTITVEMFDGLSITIEAARVGDYGYAQFSAVVHSTETDQAAEDRAAASAETEPATATEDVAGGEGSEATKAAKLDPVAEAAAINQRVAGWAYQLPDFKFELLKKRIADLTSPVDSK